MEYFKNGQDELLMDYNLKFGSNVQNDQLQLVWDYLPGAEEYDLEWVYIDKYSNFSTAYPNPTKEDPFSYQEPTRITTTDQHFILEMNYPQGVVYFRVRGVGHYEDYPEQPRYTKWHYGIENPVKFEINEAYEGKKIWQSVTTYAEEGKYKKVISYLDGSMRSRQVVTHLNTDNLALVAETRYDYEGRGVVQILPVPLEKEENEMVASLHYRNGLNRIETRESSLALSNATGYEKYLYDNGQKELATLLHEPDPAHPNDKGAGLYYSKYNTLNTIHRDYLPDANGYAFTQVVYDNEGRVKSQGGVGELFQYDTEGNDRRSTEYFYANTNETELRRMFGKNVGKSSHYRKQAVQDANGQVSVSYMDQAGNVIATALAGESPEMLLALDKDTDEVLSTIDVSLDANNRIDLENHTSISTNEILNVTPNTAYIINYKMGGEDAQVIFEGETYCENCKYNLNVYIYTPNEEKISLVENQEIGGQDCDIAAVGQFDFEEKVIFKEIGTYTLIKELTLNKDAIEEVRRRIEESEDFKTLSTTIINQYISNIDETNCEICVEDNCLDDITSIDDWSANLQQVRCQNIEAQIMDWVNEEPTVRTMQDHPEYCHLEDCNTNAPSTIYSQKMSLIKNWTEALQKGYARPLDISIAPTVNTFSYDPYFTNSTCYGYGSIATMQQLLSNVAVDENGNSLNAWQAALAAATQQASVVNIPIDELRWQFFYGYYTQAKNTLHRDILADRGCLYGTYIDNGIEVEIQDPIVIDPVLPTTPQEQNEFFDENFPPLNCEQQVATWMEQIYALCDELTETQKADIQTNLEAYCAITNDGGNAYGFLYYEDCVDETGRTAATSSKINPIIAQNLKTDSKTQQLIKNIQEDKQKLENQKFGDPKGGGGLNPIDPKGGGTVTTKGGTLSPELNDCLCYQRYEAPHYEPGLDGNPVLVYGYDFPDYSYNSPCSKIAGFSDLMFCARSYQELLGKPILTWAMVEHCGLSCTPKEPQQQPDCICQLTQQYNGIVPFAEAKACFRNNRDYFIETFGEDGEITSYIKQCAKINVLIEINGEHYVDMAALEQCLNTSFGCTTPTNICDLGYGGTVAEIKAILGYTQRPADTDQSDNAKMARCIWHFDDDHTVSLAQLEACAGVVLDCPQGTGCNTSGNEYLDNIKAILDQTQCTTTFEQIIVDNPCKSYITHEKTSQKEYPVLKYPEYNYPTVTGAPGLNTNASDKYQQFGQGDFTLEAYVTLNGTAGYNYNIMYAVTPSGDHQDYYYKGFFWNVDKDTRQVNFWFPGGRAHTGEALPMNECVHVSVVRKSGNIQIYFNGQPQSMYMKTFALQEAFNWNIDFSTTKRRRIHIAAHSFFGTTQHAGGYFPGVVREVRMWNEAKIPTQFTSPDELVVDNPTNEPNLLGYWKINEGQGNRIIDYSANPNDAFFTYNISAQSRLPEWEEPTQCVITGDFTQTIRVCAEYDQTVLDDIFPTFPTLAELEQKCKDELREIATLQAQEELQRILDQKQEEFLQTYYANCFAEPFTESLNYEYTPSEYHYTLYYYDQAGSLVQTVPPKGVELLTVAQAQAGDVNPNHRMRTRYRYNSLGQPRWQDSPDGGTSTFVYDDLGQLRLSQNAEQALHGQYSYTKFDNESRTIEVGQLETTKTLVQLELAMNDLQTGASFPALGYEKTEITRTFYDFAPETGDPSIEQTYLRGRIAATLVQEDGETTGARSLYSYDIMGNVHQLWQQLPELEETKTLTYDYDLVSGNVHEVNYQKGKTDEFSHRYYYDADNRITSVETSHDGYIWDEDAKYQYYAHMPLARTEIGEYKVQAMDYAYTLQGWVKGVNQFEESTTTTEKYKYVSQKTASYALHYYQNEYQSIEGHSWTSDDAIDLFNGNITSMQTTLPTAGGQTMSYQYDQLNRIRLAHVANTPNKYRTEYTYDANGNILTLNRNNQTSAIDRLSYTYNSIQNNRLNEVEDGSTNIEGVNGTQTYAYDAVGNLTENLEDDIESIEWNVYGKIESVEKKNNQTQIRTHISYRYDPTGQRIYKKVETDIESKTTHYVRDVTGNVITIYENEEVKEVTVYGSSRLALYNGKTEEGKQTLGNKVYEMSNHLGNVLVNYTDNKYGQGTGSKADTYAAFVVSESDYYPFGMAMAERSVQNELYRYGFNTQEKSTEIGEDTYTAEFWQYSATIARRWNVDPVIVYKESSYAVFRNNPIKLNDVNGDCSGDDCPERVLTKKIKSGDTFYNIAKNSNGKYTVSDLRNWNKDVNENDLKVGQRINIEDPNRMDIYTEEKKTYTYRYNEDLSHTLTYTKTVTTKVIDNRTGEVVRSEEHENFADEGKVTIMNNNGRPLVTSQTGAEDEDLELWKRAFTDQMKKDPTYSPYTATRENCPTCTAQGLETTEMLGDGTIQNAAFTGGAIFYIITKLKGPGSLGWKSRFVQAGFLGVIGGTKFGNFLGDTWRKNINQTGRQDVIETKIKIFNDSRANKNTP
ncbi:LamG-like jellyroll fold domain-containing protein (plasmid) [Bernardetia sp. OM2101]|uniref:LamG-like jellyroll fold domain-containing protein n=1 Tax=Bernardetia sp. OM2101 TaxID=3344876 RepID=UPI0035D0E7A2